MTGEEKTILEGLKSDIEEIKKLLLGNGKVGVAEMSRRAFEGYQKSKKTKQGYIDWIFRASIMIILVYIAGKVGLS